MRNEIHKIQRKVGITSIYVTHDQSEAMSLSDRIIIMKAGHIEQIGTPHEVYAQPATPFVADFIGMANITPGKITAADANGVTVEYLGITSQKKNITNLHAGDECKVVTRPEGLKLGRTGMVPCKVVSSVFMGESQDYVVDAGGNKIQVKEYNPINKEVFAAGADAFLTIDVDSMHLI
jgi:iron(III) transport system ATP-binding protein